MLPRHAGRPAPSRAASPSAGCISIGLAALASLTLLACQDPLLTANESRSPFDRYDAVRNQCAPQFVEDQYGRRQPNLRGRLQPKE